MAITKVLFVIGGALCLTNFYLSFLRYPVHRLRGGNADTHRSVSGIPLFGSILVAISLVPSSMHGWWLTAGLLLIAVDTGGLHWFAAVMIWRSLRDRTRSH